LLHLYDQLWNSITRAEQGLWQFVAIYASILGIHWAIGEKQPSLAANLTIVASYWGINIAINTDKWFERNRMMVINIEKDFLNKDDTGKIIPASYHIRKPPNSFISSDRIIIHVIIFATIIVLSILDYWSALWNTYRSALITGILVVGGLIATVVHRCKARKELREFVEETKKVEEE